MTPSETIKYPVCFRTYSINYSPLWVLKEHAHLRNKKLGAEDLFWHYACDSVDLPVDKRCCELEDRLLIFTLVSRSLPCPQWSMSHVIRFNNKSVFWRERFFCAYLFLILQMHTDFGIFAFYLWIILF